MEQEPKTPRERAEDLIRLLIPDWRPTPQQVLWAIRIVLAFVIVLGVLTLIGRPFGITLWQWLDLLIIPAVLAIGGYLFTRSENRAARFAAQQRAQDEALQAYLEQIGNLLLDKDRPLHQSKEGNEVRTLARAQTLTVLTRLDNGRKGSVLQFLYESGLIAKERLVLTLTGANLSGAKVSRRAKMTGANLVGTDLSGADLRVDLSGSNLSKSTTKLNRANLSGAGLNHANLEHTELRGANLSGANIMNTNLRVADLRETNLSRASLSGTALTGANLSSANLSAANLLRADMSRANLTGAKGWTEEQLDQAESLNEATMPNGQKYEDWLKSKDRGKAGENSGSQLTEQD